MAPKAQPYQAKDGTITWHVRYRIKGRPNPVKDTFDGPTAQAEAEKFARLVERVGGEAARATRIGSESAARGSMTLATWLERHLADLAGSATSGTVAGYRSLAENTWLPRLGSLPLDAITRQTVSGWVAWQRQQTTVRGTPYKPKSIRNAHGLLSSVLASAVAADLIPKNVARGVPLPDDAADVEMDVLTMDEWERFIAAMDEHYRPLTWFLLTAGCRIGEALAVQVRDLDPARRTVRIRRAWKKADRGVYLGSTKSKRSKRTVLLPAELSAQLATMTRGRDAGDLVFVTRTGRKVDPAHYRERQWDRALTRAGITKRITPHSLRHTSASWLLAEGVSPITVQHRLGHESLATTSRVYAHLLTDAQVGAAAVMERATPRVQIEA